ncbi:hypothetical protein NQ314_003944 [Rhamnusium bicolor]|uniref:Uncharacterized protein n=1 Tax=Rhamnusium bicolor TaxID=1586634 RepID=A0AAV8ZMY2_9CUCU|nr:hypothetical protein NQ314_003944 [Rhamnusium bicolor]
MKDWKLWQERLESYIKVNKITDELRVATLLSLLGPATYKIVRDLSYPDLPKDNSYDQLCEILSQQFAHHPSVWRERIKFCNAKQENGESFGDFYARLKSLSVNCKFGNRLESVLKDRLMSGLHSGKILDRLCEEDISKSLNEMVKLGMQKESEVQQKGEVNKISCTARRQMVNALVKNSNPVGSGDVRNRWRKESSGHTTKVYRHKQGLSKPCSVCGNDHLGHCKYANFNCNICKKRGHLAKVCRVRQKACNYIDIDTEVIGNNHESIFAMNSFDSADNIFKFDVFIDNVKHKLEADCGASVSCINEEMYLCHFSKYVLNNFKRLYSESKFHTSWLFFL